MLEAQNSTSINIDLATEVRRRLQQLEYLYSEVERRHSRYMELVLRDHRRQESLRKSLGLASGSLTLKRTEDHAEMDQLTLQIETFTECFYYLGARVRRVIRQALPGLQSFECSGVRDVRNHLLEHPEKNSKVFAQSFGFGGDRGPTVKIERDEGQEYVFRDAGLWANAEEFRKNLEAALERVMCPSL